MKVLSNNHNLSNIQVRYVTSKNKLVSKKIPIYNDDTCKDVLLKLSSLILLLLIIIYLHGIKQQMV